MSVSHLLTTNYLDIKCDDLAVTNSVSTSTISAHSFTPLTVNSATISVTGAINGVVPIFLSQVNSDMALFNMPHVFLTNGLPTSSSIDCSAGTLPLAFRPQYDVIKPIIVMSNSVPLLGFLTILSNGGLSIKRADGVDFAGPGAPNGYYQIYEIYSLH